MSLERPSSGSCVNVFLGLSSVRTSEYSLQARDDLEESLAVPQNVDIIFVLNVFFPHSR